MTSLLRKLVQLMKKSQMKTDALAGMRNGQLTLEVLEERLALSGTSYDLGATPGLFSGYYDTSTAANYVGAATIGQRIGTLGGVMDPRVTLVADQLWNRMFTPRPTLPTGLNLSPRPVNVVSNENPFANVFGSLRLPSGGNTLVSANRPNSPVYGLSSYPMTMIQSALPYGHPYGPNGLFNPGRIDFNNPYNNIWNQW